MTTQTSKSYVLESFEGEWAVLEADAETTFPAPRAWLPDNVKVDDVLSAEVASGGDEGRLKLAIDAERLEGTKAVEEEVRQPAFDPVVGLSALEHREFFIKLEALFTRVQAEDTDDLSGERQVLLV